jgi:hypothetical protein
VLAVTARLRLHSSAYAASTNGMIVAVNFMPSVQSLEEHTSADRVMLVSERPLLSP